MKSLVIFADPEAVAKSVLTTAFVARPETYKPSGSAITNTFPTSALTGDVTHLQVELDGVPGGDYPVTERATVRVTAYSAPGKQNNAKALASLAQGLLYTFAGNSDCYGFTVLTGRLKTIDPTTKNNIVSFTVRANMRPHAA